MKGSIKRKLIYIILTVTVILAWQYFGSNNNTVRLLISYPTLITQYFAENYSLLLVSTGITLFEAVTGLVIATIFSFLMMIICFYIPKFLDFVMPIMVTSQIIPLIVLAPFFVLLFGIGYSSKILMASLMSFFPIFVNFATGVKSIKKEIFEFAYINNATTLEKIKSIYFPLSFPSIFAGLKISATLSVIGAIVAEFTGAEAGLGKNLYLSAKRLEPELMMNSLILSMFLGGGVFLFIVFFEKKFKKY